MICKVLSSRFRKEAGQVIGLYQNSVAEGKQIIDVVIKVGEYGVICKLDVEKAYDHVDWSSHLCVGENANCGGRKWLTISISTHKYFILVNVGVFPLFRGPLSRVSSLVWRDNFL